MHNQSENRPMPLPPRTEAFGLAEILVTLRRVCDEIEQETGLLSQEQACLVADICTRFSGEVEDLSYVLGTNANLVTQPLTMVTDAIPLNTVSEQ
ncbi:MAG: hypothetical protein AAF629_00350 [Chloroflexota bacterium]